MSKTKLLFASGVLAGIIYVLLILLIILQINESSQKKLIAKPTPTYSAINIDLLPIPKPQELPMPKQEPKKEAPKEVKVAEEVKTKSVPKSQNGLRKLFSDIPNLKDDKSKKIKKEELAKLEARRKLQEEQRRIEVERKKMQEQNEQLLKKSQEAIKSLQSKIQSANAHLQTIKPELELKTSIPVEDTDGIYEEWLNQIYKILYQNWHSNYQKNVTMSVVLTIDTVGKMTYRVLRYSSIPSYDSQIIDLLDKLKETKLPPYPKNKTISIEVNFKSKTT